MTVSPTHEPQEWLSRAAADLAGTTALLLIGERLGLVEHLVPGGEVEPDGLAAMTDLPVPAVCRYLEALRAADLVEPTEGRAGRFRVTPALAEIRHRVGYLAWAVFANYPYLANAREFLTDPDAAAARHRRDPAMVLTSSRWMDSLAAHPTMRAAVVDARPSRVVDLGGGCPGLLVSILQALPNAVGVGLEESAELLAVGAREAAAAGVADRISMIGAPFGELPADACGDADVITANFVFHDLLPEDEAVVDRSLARIRARLRPGGLLVMAEVVPYRDDEADRRFSAIVTYTHLEFMRRRLIGPAQWQAKLSAAGFVGVRTASLGYPAGQLFLAHAPEGSRR